MKYYEQLAKLQCFSKQDIIKLVGNDFTAKSLLYDYKQKGLIESIKRNLYVLISLETKAPIANRFKIASKITRSSYISHHSAFEYYGCYNQVFNEVYVSSNQRFTSFEYDGIKYKYIQSKLNSGIEVKENIIKVSSLERTVIDSIIDFENNSGIEEVIKCIELIPSLDEKKLRFFLKQYDKKIVYQKVGYILELFKSDFDFSDKLLSFCKNNISKSKRYLYKNMDNSSSVYNSYWQLYVPTKLLRDTLEGDFFDAPI